jgi:hypothetical protein
MTLPCRPVRQEAIKTARKLQWTPQWQALYGVRAGFEDCLSHGVRLCGLRRARYGGLARIHPQHLATAAVLDIVRLDAWLRERP